MDAKPTVLGDHYSRIQMEVPNDGDLEKLLVQVFHELNLYYLAEDGKPDYSHAVGKAPGVGLMNMRSIPELEVQYPGLTQALKFLQRVVIIEATKLVRSIQEQQNDN